MGFVKKIGKELRRARDKITGADKAEEEARRAAEEAERKARERAELEAAQQASKTAGQGDKAATVSVGDDSAKGSAQKKKLKGGKKGLSIARASGSGINI